MQEWQLQEAKAKLTQLINQAKHAPQIITRHGKKESVVIDYDTFEALTSKNEDLVSFFRHSPLMHLEDELRRDTSSFRDITF